MGRTSPRPRPEPRPPGDRGRHSRQPSRGGAGLVTELIRRLQAYFAGRTGGSTTWSSTSSTTPLPGRAARGAPRRAPGRGRHATASSRPWPARRGARPGGGHVLRAQPARALLSRATGSSPPAGSARTARTDSPTSAACWRSRACSLTTCATSSPRSHPSRSATGSPSSRASSTSPGARTCADAGTSPSTSTSPAPGRHAAPSRFCAASASIPRSARTVRPAFDHATRFQLHVAGSPLAYATLHRAGVLDARHRPLERPPRRVLARRCCRGAYLRGALLGAGSLSGPTRPAPRDPDRRAGGRPLPRRGRGTGRSRAARARASTARRRLREGNRADRRPARARRERPTSSSRSRSTPSSPPPGATRTGSRTPITRTSCARAAPPHVQLEAVRRLEEAAELDRLPEVLREIAGLRRRHPTLSIAELGRRCSPPATKASAYRRLLRSAGAFSALTLVIRVASRLARQQRLRHTRAGGSALVRRRIQTPSVATVSGVVVPEGRVVLGASPPAPPPCGEIGTTCGRVPIFGCGSLVRVAAATTERKA